MTGFNLTVAPTGSEDRCMENAAKEKEAFHEKDIQGSIVISPLLLSLQFQLITVFSLESEFSDTTRAARAARATVATSAFFKAAEASGRGEYARYTVAYTAQA